MNRLLTSLGVGKAKTKRAYHHGDLRQALIDAAIDLIGEKDIGALSLRAIARRVGVTPAAPYHHFKDKNELLAAIGKAGFEKMAVAIDEAAAAADTDPAEQLRAMGRGYVSFAISNPTTYRVMFGSDRKDVDEFPELHEAGQCCFDRLIASSAALLAERATEASVQRIALTCWSACHGLATLWNDGPLANKFGSAGIDELYEAMSRTLVDAALHEGPE